MTNAHKILAALLGLQILIGVIVYWPRSAPAQPGEPLLGELTAEQLTGLAFSDQTGSQVRLARLGAEWILPEADGYPADSMRLDAFVERLLAVQTNRLVTQTAASHRRLLVAEDEFERRIDLQTNDGRQVTVFIGSSAGTRATHIRLAGQDQVYLTGEVGASDAGAAASNWIDTTYQNIPADQVRVLTLENAAGIFTFERDAQGNWIFPDLGEGEEFNSNLLPTWLNRVATLRMLAPLGTEALAAYGLDTPVAILTVTTISDAGLRDYTLAIGAQSERPAGYIVKSSESAYYAVVAGFNVEEFITATRETFLVQPPPETPATP
jgi:hypothetical protein